MEESPPASPRIKPVSYDCLLKFLLVGEPGVGKTSMAVRFADDTFTDSYIATVGIDFQVRVVQLSSGKHAKLQIWDTAGQERYHAVTSSYYRSAHGIMLVFDVTKITSFETMMSWLRKIRENAPPSVLVMLVGNKCETLHRYRQVPRSVAKKFAAQHGLLYAEVSAKENSNIDEAFTHLADGCWQRFQEEASAADERRPKVFLNSAAGNGSSKARCCLK